QAMSISTEDQIVGHFKHDQLKNRIFDLGHLNMTSKRSFSSEDLSSLSPRLRARSEPPAPPSRLMHGASTTSLDSISEAGAKPIHHSLSASELNFDNESGSSISVKIKPPMISASSMKKPIIVKRSSSIVTPTVANTSKKNDGSIGEDEFMRVFENIPEFTNIKDIDSIFAECLETLSNSSEWTKINNALLTLRSMASNKASHFIICAHISDLSSVFGKLSKNLRSAVLKETCLTFAFLAMQLQCRFDRALEVFCPLSVTLLSSYPRIMKTSVIVCLSICCKYVQSQKMLDAIIKTFDTKAKEIRSNCVRCVSICLENWPIENLKKVYLSIFELIKRSIEDADVETRLYSRNCCIFLKEKFPSNYETFFQGLNVKYQKQISTHLSTNTNTIAKEPIKTVKQTTINPRNSIRMSTLHSHKAAFKSVRKPPPVRELDQFHSSIFNLDSSKFEKFSEYMNSLFQQKKVDEINSALFFIFEHLSKICDQSYLKSLKVLKKSLTTQTINSNTILLAIDSIFTQKLEHLIEKQQQSSSKIYFESERLIVDLFMTLDFQTRINIIISAIGEQKIAIVSFLSKLIIKRMYEFTPEQFVKHSSVLKIFFQTLEMEQSKEKFHIVTKIQNQIKNILDQKLSKRSEYLRLYKDLCFKLNSQPVTILQEISNRQIITDSNNNINQKRPRHIDTPTKTKPKKIKLADLSSLDIPEETFDIESLENLSISESNIDSGLSKYFELKKMENDGIEKNIIYSKQVSSRLNTAHKKFGIKKLTEYFSKNTHELFNLIKCLSPWKQINDSSSLILSKIMEHILPSQVDSCESIYNLIKSIASTTCNYKMSQGFLEPVYEKLASSLEDKDFNCDDYLIQKLVLENSPKTSVKDSVFNLKSFEKLLLYCNLFRQSSLKSNFDAIINSLRSNLNARNDTLRHVAYKTIALVILICDQSQTSLESLFLSRVEKELIKLYLKTHTVTVNNGRVIVLGLPLELMPSVMNSEENDDLSEKESVSDGADDIISGKKIVLNG
ncbi:MAG: CLIP-associating protein 1, partial [Paramarteilia canceri]